MTEGFNTSGKTCALSQTHAYWTQDGPSVAGICEEGAGRVRGIPGGVETGAHPAPPKAQAPPQRRVGTGRSRVGAGHLSLAPSPGERRHRQPDRAVRGKPAQPKPGQGQPSRRQPRHPQPLIPRQASQPRHRCPQTLCPGYRPTPCPKARLTHAPCRRQSRRIPARTITAWPPRPFPARATRPSPPTATRRHSAVTGR